MKPTINQIRSWRSEVVASPNAAVYAEHIAVSASVWASEAALGLAYTWISQNVDKATADRFKRDLG